MFGQEGHSLGVDRGGNMKRKARVLPAAALVCGAVFLTGSAAPAKTAPIIAKTSVPTTTLANAVLPNLGAYTDLGTIAPGQEIRVVIPLQHDGAAIAALEASLNDPSSSNYEN